MNFKRGLTLILFLLVFTISFTTAIICNPTLPNGCPPEEVTSTSTSGVIPYDCGTGNCVQSTIGGYVCVPCSSGSSSYNATYDATSKDVTANRTAFLSTFNSTYANFVQGNSSFNQSLTNALYWLQVGNQNGLTGTKTGSYNINTTGTINAGETVLIGNLTIGSLSSELAPSIIDANWNVNNTDWVYPIVGGVLQKDADGTSIITPTASTWVVAGETYKISITFSAFSTGFVWLKIGNSPDGYGFELDNAVTTYTYYLTANDTGKLAIRGSYYSRFTISAISVKKITSGIGDLTAYGDITALNITGTNVNGIGTGYFGRGIFGRLNDYFFIDDPTYNLQVLSSLRINTGESNGKIIFDSNGYYTTKAHIEADNSMSNFIFGLGQGLGDPDSYTLGYMKVTHNGQQGYVEFAVDNDGTLYYPAYIDYNGLVTTKITATTTDPELMVYSPTTRERILVLDSAVPQDKKGMNVYFNKDTGKMEYWNALTGNITDNQNKVIANMNSLGEIKKGYYFNYSDYSFYKKQIVSLVKVDTTKSAEKSKMLEVKVINVTSTIPSTCYKYDSSFNSVAYTCGKPIVTGVTTETKLKSDYMFNNSNGEFYHKIITPAVKVNNSEATE